MTDLVRTVSELTFAYADRKARWLNRYNNDSRDLEWAYKEEFYQKRIEELLGLIPGEALERIHVMLTHKMDDLPGEAERKRNPANLAS